jgi:hypothetical protein
MINTGKHLEGERRWRLANLSLIDARESEKALTDSISSFDNLNYGIEAVVDLY